MTKPTLRLRFTDFPGPFNVERLRSIIEADFELDESSNAPDYVIHSAFGSEYLGYGDCVRIFYTGENLSADFNLTDYAITFDHLSFGDRHIRIPNFVLYSQWDELLRRRQLVRDVDIGSKTSFCNFIYSNGDCHPFRDRFFQALNGRQRVDSFGKHLRNCSIAIGEPYAGDWTIPKVEAQRNYFFSIAFENASHPGYTTEKIVHALAADTVPIYFGDPRVCEIFNPDRIVIADESDMDSTIDEVLALYADPVACRRKLTAPVFANDPVAAGLTEQHLGRFLAMVVSQPLDLARRRSRHCFGPKYERRRLAEVNAERRLRTLRRPRELISGIKSALLRRTK